MAERSQECHCWDTHSGGALQCRQEGDRVDKRDGVPS
jgi:hypothetical protein